MTDDSRTFIQWKGTDVCMDWVCVCGLHHHIDADFCYVLRCAECGRFYLVGTSVELTEISSPPDHLPAAWACAGDDTYWRMG